MSAILADHLDLWGFEEDFHLFSDGSIGFGLECTLLDIDSENSESVNAIAVNLNHFLNGLSEGIDVQFCRDVKSGYKNLLSRLEDKSRAQSSGFNIEKSRFEQLNEQNQAGLLPEYTLKIFIRRKFENNLIDRPRLFSRASKFPEITESRLRLEVNMANRLRDEILEKLERLGLEPRQITPREVVELVYNEWNPDRGVSLSEYDPEDIRSSLLFTGCQIDEQGFTLAKTKHRVITLKELPDSTYAGMTGILASLPFDSRLLVNFHVPNQEREIESLKTKRRIAYSMVVGRSNGMSDPESSSKYSDLEGLLNNLVTNGEKIFKVSVSILLRSKSESELDAQVNQTLSLLRELSGSEGMLETYPAFEIFSESAIPNARGRVRERAMKTSTLSDLLPVFGPWRGHREGRILLKSQMGSLISFDPFDSSLTNANQLISGGSGSGKSFLTNLLLLQMLKFDPKIFFVDIGGSYKKFCENLGGQYLNLSLESGHVINPFDLNENETVPSSQKIKFLVGLIEIITKEEDETRLGKFERAEIEDAVHLAYENDKTPTLSTVKDILIQNQNVKMRRYGKILSTWCGHSPFGKLLDGKTNIKLNRSIVAFDLKGLEAQEELQKVYLYLITDLIWRVIQGERERMKFLVFDECWKLLRDEAGSKFIEEVFRTFRKYYASAIAISQDLDDFANSKIAGALLPNCAVKWVLMQSQGNSKRLRDVLNLNETQIGQVQRLAQQKGLYSEAFLLSGTKKRTVVSIEPTPIEYWLSTTDPIDLREVDRFRCKNPNSSNQEIIESLSIEYPNGFSAQNNY